MCKGPVAGRVRVVGGIGRMPGHWRTENKGKQGKGGQRVRREQSLALQFMSPKGNGDPLKIHEKDSDIITTDNIYRMLFQ